MATTILPTASAKTKSSSDFRINWFKLWREVIVIAAIVIAVVAIRVLPEIWDKPIYDDHSSDRYYFNLAKNFDSEKGPDAKLEAELVAAASNDQISIEHLHYNKFALAEYSYKVGRINTATSLFEEISTTADPYLALEVWSRLKECYKLLGDEDKADTASSQINLYK